MVVDQYYWSQKGPYENNFPYIILYKEIISQKDLQINAHMPMHICLYYRGLNNYQYNLKVHVRYPVLELCKEYGTHNIGTCLESVPKP